MLGEEVHGQSVLCGEYDLRGVRPGTLEYANQHPTGLVLGVRQVPVQHGPGIYVWQRCEDAPNRRVLDLDIPDTWGADDISSADEIWGIPVGEEGPPESRDLFLQVCCWTEDTSSGRRCRTVI